MSLQKTTIYELEWILHKKGLIVDFDGCNELVEYEPYYESGDIPIKYRFVVRCGEAIIEFYIPAFGDKYE